MKYKSIRDGINAAQKKALPWAVDLNDAKIICFSDHHRGSRDGADDFENCEQTYLNALHYYLERGYHLILLGDVDELWENKPEDIVKNYPEVMQAEAEFHLRKRLTRVWGNHDDLWRFPDAVKTSLKQFFPQMNVVEAIDMKIIENGEALGKILWLHGHQGTLMSAQLAGFSKFAVRLLWRPIQRIFNIKLSTARNTPKLRYKTDKAMDFWANRRSRQLVVCGHTHQYIFGSLAIEDGDKPCYFNTGACSYGNGNISGIEISNGKIRLIEWEPESSEPFHVAKEELREILRKCE